LRGSEIIVAVQEERLSRIKRHRIYGAQRSLAVAYCLSAAGISAKDLSLVVLSGQRSNTSPEEDVHLNPQLQVDLHRVPVLLASHHLAHAASTFYTSGWDAAAILVVDGIGSPQSDLSAQESRAIRHAVRDGYEAISIYLGSRAEGLVPIEKHLVEDGAWLTLRQGQMPTFGTLGGMYSAAAYQIFGNAMDAGKVMGLAPLGQALHMADEFLCWTDSHFKFSDQITRKFDGRKPWPEHQPEYQVLASSVQAALEKGLLKLVRHVRQSSSEVHLCYSGGVALNSVANTRILRSRLFDDLYVFPAAEDSGVAVGAAYIGLQALCGQVDTRRSDRDSVGVRYSEDEVTTAIHKTPAIKARSGNSISQAVEILSQGGILGWFQRGSELGPRALGARSILCDPRRAANKELLNGRIKRREGFRPFAPAILRERVHEWFEVSANEWEYPFMLHVYPFRQEKRALVPAVVHVDGTGRLQTVARETDPVFHELIRTFEEATGVPIVLNTSMNVRGEPIAETPLDALQMLLISGLDACVIENRLVTRDESIGSLLELTPYIAAETIKRISHPVDSNNVICHIATAWGEFVRTIPSETLPLVTAIDGQKSGLELLDNIRRSSPQLTPEALETMLADLARAKIVFFKSSES